MVSRARPSDRQCSRAQAASRHRSPSLSPTPREVPGPGSAKVTLSLWPGLHRREPARTNISSAVPGTENPGTGSGATESYGELQEVRREDCDDTQLSPAG